MGVEEEANINFVLIVTTKKRLSYTCGSGCEFTQSLWYLIWGFGLAALLNLIVKIEHGILET